MSDERVFPNTGVDFSGWNNCAAWLEANGYSYGEMQRDAPIGVLKGDYAIAKWRNMSALEKRGLHGTVTWGGLSPRRGAAILVLKGATP